MKWQVPSDLVVGAFGATMLATDDQAEALAALGIGAGELMPSGTILMWSGSIASIPSGYVLCDGANSTPDLRDKFLVGAGTTYAVGATGGAVSDTVTIDSAVTDITHTDTVNPNIDAGGSVNPDPITSFVLNDPGHTHTASAVDTLPPYYALAYIMKT